jgi:hypothetical protein
MEMVNYGKKIIIHLFSLKKATKENNKEYMIEIQSKIVIRMIFLVLNKAHHHQQTVLTVDSLLTVKIKRRVLVIYTPTSDQTILAINSIQKNEKIKTITHQVAMIQTLTKELS